MNDQWVFLAALSYASEWVEERGLERPSDAFLRDAWELLASAAQEKTTREVFTRAIIDLVEVGQRSLSNEA